MSGRIRRAARGMTLLELMIGLSITALIAGAISGMMSAVTSGIHTNRDARTVMIRAHAGQTRLSAYLAPCRSVLAVNENEIVVWFEDERADNHVQVKEVRWLRFDAVAMELGVHFVQFPAVWTAATVDLENITLAPDEDWDDVLLDFAARGLERRLTLIDGLGSFSATTDEPAAIDSRHVTCALGMETTAGIQPVHVSATIRMHQPPERLP
jgi:prepilin-type N-terminal cleavage/methylation domain-containing protein